MNQEDIRGPSDSVLCSVCSQRDVRPFAELRGVPINCTSVYWQETAARSAPRGNIRLGHCMACGAIRNLEFDASRVAYDEAYENSLHFSPAFERYADALAHRLLATYDVHDRDVVEIGSGKGDFLRLLCRIGNNRGTGYDPSAAAGEEPDVGRGVRFLQEFYSESHADRPADLVCCRHVLEHIPDPRSLVSGLRRTLASRPDSVVYFEVPDAEKVLTAEGMWDVIYPHCSYFAAPALRYLFESQGFRVLRVDRVFGDQFVSLDARPGPIPDRPAFPAADELERLHEHVESFAVVLRNYLDRQAELLARARSRSRRVGLWGVGAKAVTFLNAVEGAERIDRLIDLNPRKQGSFVPGTGQRIDVPESLAGDELDELLIMNPMYRDEIAKRLAELGVHAEIRVV